MKKCLGVLSIIAMTFCVTSFVNADIMNVSVHVSTLISLDNFPDVSGNDSGITFASSNISEPSTGVAVSAMLNLNALAAETGNLNFDFTMDGNGYTGPGGLGAPGNVNIPYHADIDSVLVYSWNFDYLGTNPFGMNRINVYFGGAQVQLGNVGIVGHHEGSDTFNLLGGNDYILQLQFMPNVSAPGGGLGNIDGQLRGDISFNFNGTTVPEPATMLLLGSGLLGLWGVRKKLKK